MILKLLLLSISALLSRKAIGQTCSKPGVQCDTFSCNIVVCPTIGANPTILNECIAQYKHCNYNNNTQQYECAAGPCHDPNAYHPLFCITTGTFPNPYKCNSSYFCSLTGVPPLSVYNCDSGEYYNTATGACTVGTCPRSAILCDFPGQGGKVDDRYCFACNGNLDVYVYLCSGEKNDTAVSYAPVTKCGEAVAGVRLDV